MSTNEDVRIRGKKSGIKNAWALGSIPRSVIVGIGKQLVHRIAVGHSDITGDDFGTIFANAIEGTHRESPLGVADVVLDGNAWSVKTVKSVRPFKEKKVRLISGRNSPDYSLGITDPHKDIQATGKAVLAIWNKRVNEALGEHNDIRVAILIRNLETKEFVLFEENAARYAADDYVWTKNGRNNFEGHDKVTGEHKFTWQSHGGQFTVKRVVPGSAIKFIINKNPPVIEAQHILNLTKYNDNWIEIIG